MSTVTLPSGLVGEVRGLTGKDGRYLSNDQLVRDEAIEDYVFSHCWTNTLDDGPYAFDGKPPDWGKVLIGDRFVTLIAVREETYPGDDYVMKMQCERAGCRKRFEWEIQLGELLAKKTKPLAAKDRALFQNGNRFEEVIPFTSTKFVFQLQTGNNAKRVRARIEAKKLGPKKLQERQNFLVDVVAGQIIEIEGLTKVEAIFDFLEDLPMKSIDALVPLIQSHDCGVSSLIDVECPHCGRAMQIELPFERAFFLPSSAAHKRNEAVADANEVDEEIATSETV